MKYSITFPAEKVEGKVVLPASKSISNRLLIIKALSSKDFSIEGLSDSDDTKALQMGLQATADVVDTCDGGTTMRFLTAYFAATAQAKTLTGSESIKNRPIGGLVDALNHLGAEITYLEKTGYPPVQTSGKALSGNTVEINGSVSSQFISALLLVAPTLPEGLTINIKGDIVSEPYIGMTLGLMKQAGVKSKYEKKTISVAHQDYVSEGMTVEGDRSAASYWYQITALANEAELVLQGMNEKSLQGDAIFTQMANTLGIKTEFTPEGAVLSKIKNLCLTLWLDFNATPDLLPTMAVICCLKNIRFRFFGVQNLHFKETDRIVALHNELMKLGFCIKEVQDGVIEWNGERCEPQEAISIATYNDHRIAMAFAPAAIIFPGLQIENPEVVDKSYPNFWNDLKSIGVTIVEV